MRIASSRRAALPVPPQRSLRVRIDRLVLDRLPLPRTEQRRVHDAVVAELELLWGAGALRPEFRQEVSMPMLRLGDIEIGDGTSPERVGRRIAHALYRGFSR
jgi:hypothetical protein